MKYIYLSIITLLTTAFVFAQESSITGKVTNLKTGEPIPGASVYLKNNKNTITDFDGNYSFDNLSDGNYDLFISFIGFESVNEEIIVAANKNIIKNYTLEEAVLELQDVEIVGRKRTSYKPDVTYAGAKVAVDIKDVPQSIAIVNKEVIKDQGLFRLNEVTANIALLKGLQLQLLEIVHQEE